MPNVDKRTLTGPALESCLSASLKSIQDRLSRALDQSSDPGRSVTLVAVSKKQPLEKIKILADMGQVHFGENYIQEARSKMEELGPRGVHWHFIGGLQSNKARQAAGKFVLIHSVDSLKLARELHKKAMDMSLAQPVLIQVNLAGEKQKSGVLEKDLAPLIREVLDLDHLRLDGMMIMPPFFDEPEKSRPFFAGLRKLKLDMEQRFGVQMPHLSMGMSGDFEEAVEEGATLVRVGSSLFGPRPGSSMP